MIQQLFFLPHCTFVREIKKRREKFEIVYFPLFQWTKTKVDHQMDVSKRIKLGKQPVPSRPSRRGIGFDLRYVLVCCLFMLSIFLLLGERVVLNTENYCSANFFLSGFFVSYLVINTITPFRRKVPITVMKAFFFLFVAFYEKVLEREMHVKDPSFMTFKDK